MRTGVVYRTGQLANATAESALALETLNVATVFDLRTLVEREAYPDVVPASTVVRIADVLADNPESGAAALAAFITPGKSPSIPDINAAIGSGRSTEMMVATYRDFINLTSAHTAYRDLLTHVANSGVATAFHCAGGKDRTGWGAVLLQSFVGVDDATIRRDYLASNDITQAQFGPLKDGFAAAGGDSDALAALFEVREEYLDAAWNELAARYRDLDGYFTRALGLSDDVLSVLRARIANSDLNPAITLS